MIYTEQCDIMNSNGSIIVQQVNCHGKASSLINKKLKHIFPNMFDYYKNMCYRVKVKDLMGTVHFHHGEHGKIIANMFSEIDYSEDNKAKTDIGAFRECLELVCEEAENLNMDVAIPYYTGVYNKSQDDWMSILDIITDIFQDSNVACYLVK